jgi:hypothetical protein
MKFLILILLSLSCVNAFALNIQSFRFSDSYRYSIVDDSYFEKFKSNFVLTSGLGYINSPFYVSDKKVSELDHEIIDYQYILNVGASYYVNNDLVVGMDISAHHSEVLGDTYTTLGDTVLKARYNISRTSDFSFSLNPKIYLPTGDTDNFSTNNSLGASFSGVAEFKHQEWHFLGSLGYFYSPNNELSIVDYTNLVLLTAAASYDLNSKWTTNVEAVKNFTIDRQYRQDEGDYYLTFKYKAHQLFGIYFGGGIAGLDEIDRNNFTLFAGVKIHSF